jgi:undecaprenyl-diphosphatase
VRRNAETHSELLDYVAPRLGRPAAPVILAAAAVGASRVVTGVHDPSYVLAGFDASQDLGRWLRMAAGNARILGVAGGDGTVSAGAAVALKMGLPFIPAGTFNHFAADRGPAIGACEAETSGALSAGGWPSSSPSFRCCGQASAWSTRAARPDRA